MNRIAVMPTLTLLDSVQTDWDIIVIGAGPAGAMAARDASYRGLRVLLVDRCTFPRPKVCGCCVNAAAQQLLGAEGLAGISVQGVNLHSYRLAAAGRVVDLRLTGGVAVSREELDSGLIRSAIHNGAEFLDSAEGSIQLSSPRGHVLLKQKHNSVSVRCKSAIVATGLGSPTAIDREREPILAHARSRIGAGVVVDAPNADYRTGTVYMACHRHGYVGLVRLEDGRLDIAAAMDVPAVQQLGGIGVTASKILADSGLPLIQRLEGEQWRGTAKLTRRRTRLFGDGFLVVGDAAGYVEPFTGEGIAWAMATGRAVVPFAIRAMSDASQCVGRSWSREYARLVGRRMRVCRVLSQLLRMPSLVQVATWILAHEPRLVRVIEKSFNTSYSRTTRASWNSPRESTSTE